MTHGNRPDLIRVVYPSGRRLPLFHGSFRLLLEAQTGPMPLIEGVDGQVHVLDPRAVVRQAEVVLYTPRDVPADEHTRPMRRWLRQHPRWGHRGAVG